MTRKGADPQKSEVYKSTSPFSPAVNTEKEGALTGALGLTFRLVTPFVQPDMNKIKKAAGIDNFFICCWFRISVLR
jgi:hypothetical protein